MKINGDFQLTESANKQLAARKPMALGWQLIKTVPGPQGLI
jgi:hypothetical protein